MTRNKPLLIAALVSALLALPAVAAEPPGSSWADATRLPDYFSGNWQSVTGFLDNPVDAPFTARAQAYIARYKPIADIPFAGPGCKTPGMPIVQRLGSPLKFFYQPGMIAIYIENSSVTRFIKLNAQHSARPNPTYLGESVGHFEGDTLVVDSVGFADDLLFQYGDLPGRGTGPFVLPPEAIFGPHGPNLRMVERIRLVDADTLEDKLTIHDDTVWTKPYVSSPVQIFKRNRGDAGWPVEWECTSAEVLTFDPAQDKTILEDPADALKRLQQKKDR
jgi:hypothetical protein